jgi:hypothetical protein
VPSRPGFPHAPGTGVGPSGWGWTDRDGLMIELVKADEAPTDQGAWKHLWKKATARRAASFVSGISGCAK